MPTGPATDRPSYEQARDQLADLVKRLETGGLTLEQSLELWERGERLAAICEEWLEGARAKRTSRSDREPSGRVIRRAKISLHRIPSWPASQDCPGWQRRGRCGDG